MEKFEWWDQNHKRHCIDIKYCYNDWIYLYCEENKEKEDNAEKIEMLEDHEPLCTADFYPSQDEQNKMKQDNQEKFADAYFKNLENLWLVYITESEIQLTRETVAIFLSDMMFSSRKIRVIKEKRKRQELLDSLIMYLRKSTSEWNFLSQEELDEEVKYKKEEELRKLEKSISNDNELTRTTSMLFEPPDEYI